MCLLVSLKESLPTCSVFPQTAFLKGKNRLQVAIQFSLDLCAHGH